MNTRVSLKYFVNDCRLNEKHVFRLGNNVSIYQHKYKDFKEYFQEDGVFLTCTDFRQFFSE